MLREHYPLLAEACRSVASYQLRTRATIVGNICNASPAGDTIGACLVLDGVLSIHGVDGFRQRRLLASSKVRKDVLKTGDIVTAVHFPLPPQGSAGTYIKLGRNKRSDLSIVGVTALGHPDRTGASGYHFRIALASVAPVPLLVSRGASLPVNTCRQTGSFQGSCTAGARSLHADRRCARQRPLPQGDGAQPDGESLRVSVGRA